MTRHRTSREPRGGIAAAIRALAILALALASTHGRAQPPVSALPLAEYVSAYLDRSAAIDDAREAADEAFAAVADAIAAQEATSTIGLLQSASAYAEAQVRLAIDAEVLAAVGLVDVYLSRRGSVEAAQAGERIAASVLERQETLFGLGDVSRQALLAARSAHLQARLSLRSALVQLRNATADLARSIDADDDLDVVFDVAASGELPDLPDVDALVAQDPLSGKLQRDLALQRGRQAALVGLGSGLVSDQELAALEATIADIERQLRERRWQLEDQRAGLLALVASLPLEWAHAESAVASAQIALATAEFRFARGEVLSTEVAEAELAHASALRQLATLERSRYLLSLSLRDLLGEPLDALVGRAAAPAAARGVSR